MGSYAVLYYVIRNHYIKLAGNIANFNKSLRTNKIVKRTLSSLKFLFISICQIYIFRSIREAYLIIDEESPLWIIYSFRFCKLIQIVGICWSLQERVEVSIDIAEGAKG